ncbi:MAG TPA: hypothetical protein VF680_11010 [Allosphingosinicella sp.]|jgi:hypothetical protein
MNDPALLLALSGAAAAALALASGAGLKAWRQWLALRREALRTGGGPALAGELRGLRARVRRLEAIADGGLR